MLQEENEQKIKEREAALADRVPPLNLSGLSMQELLVFHFIIIFLKYISLTVHSSFYLTSCYILIPLEGVFFTFHLQDLCKDLHHKIDVVDEERYDIGLKVSNNDKEVSGSRMNRKIT